MGLRHWLIELLGGSSATPDRTASQPVSPSSTPAAAAPGLGELAGSDEEAAGLNFRSAIEAHLKWKVRLLAVVNNESTEQLSGELIARDDQCVLGKWIHGAGGQQFAEEPLFQALRANHAQFHRCAATVLTQAQSSQQAAALESLKTGEYARVSQQVIRDLAQLYSRASS